MKKKKEKKNIFWSMGFSQREQRRRGITRRTLLDIWKNYDFLLEKVTEIFDRKNMSAKYEKIWLYDFWDGH